jgi:hypothetical protein
MTILIPQPILPPSISIAAAMSLGLLQADVQITNLGNGTNTTLEYALSSGLINSLSAASSLTFASPYPQYGGQ